MVENMFWVIIIIVMLRSGRRIGAVSGELYCYGCYVWKLRNMYCALPCLSCSLCCPRSLKGSSSIDKEHLCDNCRTGYIIWL